MMENVICYLANEYEQLCRSELNERLKEGLVKKITVNNIYFFNKIDSHILTDYSFGTQDNLVTDDFTLILAQRKVTVPEIQHVLLPLKGIQFELLSKSDMTFEYIKEIPKNRIGNDEIFSIFKAIEKMKRLLSNQRPETTANNYLNIAISGILGRFKAIKKIKFDDYEDFELIHSGNLSSLKDEIGSSNYYRRNSLEIWLFDDYPGRREFISGEIHELFNNLRHLVFLRGHKIKVDADSSETASFIIKYAIEEYIKIIRELVMDSMV